MHVAWRPPWNGLGGVQFPLFPEPPLLPEAKGEWALGFFQNFRQASPIFLCERAIFQFPLDVFMPQSFWGDEGILAFCSHAVYESRICFWNVCGLTLKLFRKRILTRTKGQIILFLNFRCGDVFGPIFVGVWSLILVCEIIIIIIIIVIIIIIIITIIIRCLKNAFPTTTWTVSMLVYNKFIVP